MRLSNEEAAVVVVNWPKKLSGREILALFRQLTTLDLPASDLQTWRLQSNLENSL